jgi:hypothetical protein
LWSVIAYDNQTRSMLQTDQQQTSVSSRNKDLLVDADGSVHVYSGPRAPTGKQNNRVQTIPGKRWFMILCLYGPLLPWFDKAWRPGRSSRSPRRVRALAFAARADGTRVAPAGVSVARIRRRSRTPAGSWRRRLRMA